MKVVTNDRIVPCDVDDTLVMHTVPATHANGIYIDDPLGGDQLFLAVNFPMLRLLKEEINRGSQIIIWSRGGVKWATAVAKALNLDKEPIIVMSKPIVYLDDKDVCEWLKDRVYLNHDSSYKQKTKPIVKGDKNGI